MNATLTASGEITDFAKIASWVKRDGKTWTGYLPEDEVLKEAHRLQLERKLKEILPEETSRLLEFHDEATFAPAHWRIVLDDNRADLLAVVRIEHKDSNIYVHTVDYAPVTVLEGHTYAANTSYGYASAAAEVCIQNLRHHLTRKRLGEIHV